MTDSASLSAAQQAPPASDLRQLVRSGSSVLVLRFAEAREYVEDPGALTRIPRAPAWLTGLVSVASQAVPVVDLRHWTLGHRGALPNLATAPRGPMRILRLGDDLATWAIRVDASPTVLDLATWRAQPASLRLPLSITATHGKLTQFAHTLWTHGGETALEMDWPRLIQALQQDLSSAFASRREVAEQRTH